MINCAHCGEKLARTRRRFWEKPFYTVVFQCRGCGMRMGSKRDIFNYLGRSAKCPRCGAEEITRRSKPDKIDKMSRTPASLFQSLLGGNLYHCFFCRLQFYDLRRRHRKSTESASIPSR
jgi:hypothetical protein